jgi:hypothetical protein
MSRRQLGWIAALGLSLLFVLVTGKYAFDTDALGARTSGVVAAGVWAIGVLVALGGALGVVGAIKDTSTSVALQIVNSLAGRLTIIGLSIALGIVFAVAAARVAPPRIWSCSIAGRRVAPPDRSRCPDGSFAQMRSFQLRVQHAGELGELPTLRARIHDRAASSVALDSDRGGLCIATGPDLPTRGESRLVLSADCGVDGQYAVNLHLCDVRAIQGAAERAAELAAAVDLEVQEGSHASAIACE